MDHLLKQFLLVIGVAMVLAFLATGQMMEMHDPPVSTMEEGMRMLFVSRHIYILFGGLLCLAMSVNFRLEESSGRRSVGMLGALLVPLSALLLLAAFFLEPLRGNPGGSVSGLGLYAAFGGVLLYAIAGLRKKA